jgi:hypothetical protein
MTRKPVRRKGAKLPTKADQKAAAEREARAARKTALRSSTIGAVVAAIAGAAAGAATTAGMRAMDGLRSVTGSTPPVGGSAGADIAPPAGSASRPAVGGSGFAVGGLTVPCFATARLKPGATRDFLRACNPGDKPQFALAEQTGIPADTIRKAMAWRNPSELSGPHLMRMVSVFGPPFLAAVLDPVPRWVAEWMERERVA